MSKRSIQINPRYSSPLTAMFGEVSDNREKFLTIAGSEVLIAKSVSDVQFDVSYHSTTPSFETILEKQGTFKILTVNQYTRGKDGNENEIKEKFKGKKLIKNTPTNWFCFDPIARPFKKLYEDTVKMIPEEMLNDLTYTSTGHVQLVLRPSNLTHAICAFVIVNPDLFRFTLFNIIIVEISLIHKRRAECRHVEGVIKSVKEKIRQCGLEVISENTFGQDGVYNDKFQEIDRWGLSPYIRGKDIRVIKSADNFYIHRGWLDLKDTGTCLIEPTKTEGEFTIEVSDLMDNKITPLTGSLDLRQHPNGNYYYLETSHSYSMERYSEDFTFGVFEDVIKKIVVIHKEMIGDFNEGWEVRYKELKKEPDEFTKCFSED